MGQQFRTSLPEIPEDWVVILENPKIWRKRERGRFGELPTHSWDLVRWWIEELKRKAVPNPLSTIRDPLIVPSPNLFFNQQGLSTQMPMKQIYFTNSKNLTKINGALRCIEFVYSEQAQELQQMQDMLLNVKELGWDGVYTKGD